MIVVLMVLLAEHLKTCQTMSCVMNVAPDAVLCPFPFAQTEDRVNHDIMKAQQFAIRAAKRDRKQKRMTVFKSDAAFERTGSVLLSCLHISTEDP